MSHNTFYSIYRVDTNNNRIPVCGAGSKQMAEDLLHQHKGYEDAEVEWSNSPIYGQITYPSLVIGTIK